MGAKSESAKRGRPPAGAGKDKDAVERPAKSGRTGGKEAEDGGAGTRRCSVFINFVHVLLLGPTCEECRAHCQCPCADPSCMINLVPTETRHPGPGWVRCVCTQCG